MKSRSHSHGMNRRGFLGVGALSGAAALTGACRPATTPGASKDADAFRVPAFEFEEATVVELEEKMASGELTARRLTEAYLARIEALDRQGPMLRSVIETNPEALSIADALDKERKDTGPRGPLHGIPVLLKDNIDTADRLTTTAGSLALEGSIPEQDSHVAQRLREAGAVVLGKTNLSEWANFRSEQSTSGWSGRGGYPVSTFVGRHQSPAPSRAMVSTAIPRTGHSGRRSRVGERFSSGGLGYMTGTPLPR